MKIDSHIVCEGRSLSRHFGEGHGRTDALKGVSIAIRAGEFVGISGPSGSGKSTLLGILGLVDAPDAGEVFIEGERVNYRDMTRVEFLRRTFVGFVFQQFNLLPALSAIENVLVTALLNRIPLETARERAAMLLERVGLAARMNHLPAQLSGGEQQRVAVCRALIHEPRLILADEPTGALDSRHGDEIIELLGDIPSETRAVVMVSHSERSLNRTARRIELLDGKIV